MLKTTQEHWMVGLILVGLSVGMMEIVAQAKELALLGQPGSYFRSEVFAGTVGALSGGFITAIAGVVILSYFSDNLCPGAQILTCHLSLLLVAGPAFLIGAPVGGTLGVAMAGSRYIQGNIGLAFTGAILGEAVGLLILGATVFLSGGTISVVQLLIYPFAVSYFTAVGATHGYNFNAIIEPFVSSPTGQGLMLVGLRTSW
jgi:hypothetical protein